MSISANKSGGRVFLLLGILCAIVTAALIWYTVSLGSQGGSGPKVSVVVASSTITPDTPVTSQQVKVVQESQSTVPSNAIANPSQIVGQSLITGAVPQQTLTTNMILTASTSSNAAAGSSGCGDIPAILPKNTVAVAIPTSETPTNGSNDALTGVSQNLFEGGEYIRSGDHIDIIADNGAGQVRYLFQDLIVICVGTPSESGGAPSVLMVEATRGEAETLTFLFTHTANAAASYYPPLAIKYVIRPFSQNGTVTNPEYLSTGNTTEPAVSDPGVSAGTLSGMFSSGQ